MKPPTFEVVALTVQHWMLMLALFAMSSFAVDGWVAILYTAIAWIGSTLVIIFYPVMLRVLALLRRPWLGLIIVTAALLAANNWLFDVLSAPDEFSTDRFFYWGGYHNGEDLPLRACVWAATILSTAALWLPITDYLRKQQTRRPSVPQPASLPNDVL